MANGLHVRIRSGSSLALAAAVLLAGLAHADEPARAQADAPAGELIVRFAEAADSNDRAMVRERAEVELDSALPVPGMQLVEVEPGQTTRAAVRALERADEVLYAEPNFYRRASLRPSDPSFAEQWNFANSGQSGGLVGADTAALAAWDVTTGSAETVVAVVDTGVQLDHPDLAGSSWINPGESGAGRETNRVDDDRNGLVDDVRGWDWAGRDADPADENGHGTHVAGVVGARGNNAQGVAGTSWQTRLMALRVLKANGTGTVADAVRAYRYAAANGARIVNASLVSSSSSQAERDAIAAAPGVLFVAAAGNGGQDAVGDDNDALPQYPCTYPLANIVCVAATNRRDQLSSFSNYGARSVDIGAPGERILSTWRGGGYARLNGTSSAAPHVAGTAALLAAANPQLTVSEMRTALLGGADALATLSARVSSGGRLDSRGALEIGAPLAIPIPAPPAPAPGVAPSAPRPPQIKLDAKRRQRLGKVLKQGLKARVSCSEPCSIRLQVLLRPREARKARMSRRGRTVAIGMLRLPSARSRRVTVGLTRRARAWLARVDMTAVELHARGAGSAGTTRLATQRVALTR